MERHGPLVSCETAFEHLSDPSWVLFDCRYDLLDKEKGLREYAKGHVPGAFFAHVDRDLSGPVGDGRKGRHPLPLAFARFLALHGVGPDTQVVAYDDQAGQWASRLWWLARHHGHGHVAVLDGGLTRWKALGLPLVARHEKPRPQGAFKGAPGQMPTVDAAAIEASLAGGAGGPLRLLDARAPERYRGEAEPVDKRAGHIPGALSVPFQASVGPDQRFAAPDALRARFQRALGLAGGEGVGRGPGEGADADAGADAGGNGNAGAGGGGGSAGRVACYCGSGVTGPHLVLAMEVAGLGTPALYPGSWSEWSWPEAGRPIETGPGPGQA